MDALTYEITHLKVIGVRGTGGRGVTQSFVTTPHAHNGFIFPSDATQRFATTPHALPGLAFLSDATQCSATTPQDHSDLPPGRNMLSLQLSPHVASTSTRLA